MGYTDTQFKNSIMRRVYAVWLLKKITSPCAARIAVLIALLWQMTFYISFNNVIANIPSLTDFGFYLSAVSNTETASKMILLGVILLGVWLMRDLYPYGRTFGTRAFSILK